MLSSVFQQCNQTEGDSQSRNIYRQTRHFSSRSSSVSGDETTGDQVVLQHALACPVFRRAVLTSSPDCLDALIDGSFSRTLLLIITAGQAKPSKSSLPIKYTLILRLNILSRQPAQARNPRLHVHLQNPNLTLILHVAQSLVQD
ncbi:uncharacterized protein BO66DRAFT_467883 [Aspergillus aculeatinus CBS 121060]|uniref:Uncharacterized protein n=1 Tax=Aspergillus aculeatinus CBS 121060 TaxID=1448322 RepID=A0ACD1HME0_9EURO|nr:hypothetical protein BO66DRAFT_467883 [Aspergillus aculeatinus CBS 121060]RAH74611.1 hypothetical protein BO66DRAFT_467883 [Aspergillus aculeatinus CBS 121060]